ncbi:DNA primase [Candidatus Izimaplasma bacterium ZiA1]|uniref:DNA primase n=1 Tax=Candidatus Izimoplasma sp. ZiA1 TaxID=2024899 RepID=UPI000BAA4F6D|nr:DNA primase [Candidatus Izimaplasma bacterium ZiA1]
MPRISEEVIKQIIDKTDIVDVVSEKVTLKRQGKSYFGLCPFHNEKTPSFSVEPEKKIYKCFSCGEAGNAITFKQKLDNLTYVDAVKELAYKANVNFDFTEYTKEDPNQRLYDINQQALNFYKFYLKSTKTGELALEYLKARGITEDIINDFNIGLAPDEFDILYKTLTEKGTLVTDLHDLGLVKKSKNDNFYDLFRERIIFPIKNHKNNVVGFSGRTYHNLEDKDQPKYINSPQTKIFTKSNVLYNMDNAIAHIKKTNRVVLYEGFMDVIASHKAFIKEAVASMGTALTKEHVEIIKRYTNNVIICYDGDKAGIEAAYRAMILLEARQIDVRVVILRDNLDPDDFIQKYSIEALQYEINENNLDKIDFKYLYLKKTVDFQKTMEIERFKKEVFDLIKKDDNSVIEKHLRMLSTDTSISIEALRQDFTQYTKRFTARPKRETIKKFEIEDKYVKADRNLLKYFIEDYKYLKRFNHEFKPPLMININSDNFIIRSEIELIYQMNRRDHGEFFIELEALRERLNPKQNSIIDKALMFDTFSLEEFEDYINVIHKYNQLSGLRKQKLNMKNAENETEKLKIAQEYQKRIMEVKHGQR